MAKNAPLSLAPGSTSSPAASTPPPATAAAPTASAFVPKVRRQVTRAVLKMEVDKPTFIRAESKLYQGKEIKGTGENAQMKPATILDVVNLETGEQQQVVVGTVLASVLAESYPNDTYQGLCFQIIKRPKVGAKRYFNFEVSEIEDPTAGK